jgi:kynureninase
LIALVTRTNAMHLTLAHAQALDASDALAPLREHFTLPPGVIYLDGNSLGASPKATAARVAHTLSHEWAQDLIRSWNNAGWFEMPLRVGDKIARLIGAAPGQVVAADTTSINLFKVLSAALSLQRQHAPQRTRIVSERHNFPTDLYIAQGLCREHGLSLTLVDDGQVLPALGDDVAVVMLTHVNYRTGAMHDMSATTAAAHACGALTVWDLAHSAGAVPLDLLACEADFAVGCGYKYLNGGPGAPAFAWVHPRHVDFGWQPLSGWWGHGAPFAFSPEYTPAQGIARYQCGTQPMLSMVALDEGLNTLLSAQALGGMAALRAKSLAMTDLFMALVEPIAQAHAMSIVTPKDHAHRGSQVSLSREHGSHAIVQALIARGVIGDFRAGDGSGRFGQDILRFGFTPLYLRFEDVWHAAQHLQSVMDSGEWQEDRFQKKGAVT